MLCVRALVCALNDAKNYAQQGCAMQLDGITLNGMAMPQYFMDSSSQRYFVKGTCQVCDDDM